MRIGIWDIVAKVPRNLPGLISDLFLNFVVSGSLSLFVHVL